MSTVPVRKHELTWRSFDQRANMTIPTPITSLAANIRPKITGPTKKNINTALTTAKDVFFLPTLSTWKIRKGMNLFSTNGKYGNYQF
jgi:hypothetical protein